MKYFIFDSSNDGVVWVGPNVFVANKLKEGLIDCDMGAIGPKNPTYETLTPAFIETAHVFWDGKNARVRDMNPADTNDVYTEKKRLAALRSTSMYSLNGYSTWAFRKTQSFPHAAMDSELDSILRDCDPEQNNFSFGIVEYALTCGISNIEAYKQLRLRVDNYKSQRMRVYSYYDYFAQKINRAMSAEDIARIDAEMHKKFVKDSFI